jgi:glycosyltransferase involved in cell wall biosynthesis
MRSCLHVFSAPDGGVPEVVKWLSLGLPERGWKSWVAGPERASVYPVLEASGVPIARLPFCGGHAHPRADGAVVRSLISLMRKHRFDVVHMRSDKAGSLGRLAALAAGLPTVYNPAGWSFHPAFRNQIGQQFSLAVERALAPHTDAIICVSEAERRLALEKLDPVSDVYVVHNAAPEDGAKPPRDVQLEAFAREGPLAGCIAVLGPVKGVELFVRSAPHVFAQLPSARLAVIGNGPLRSRLQRQAQALRVDEGVRFFDFQRPSARQLQSLDVFVAPSRYEAFGIGLAEAMACGVPQVATAVGGVPEVVEHGETGFLCPPCDHVQLAQRIVQLLSDPDLRRRMATASRERHRRLFGIERMVAETAAVFDRVASNRVRGRGRIRGDTSDGVRESCG